MMARVSAYMMDEISTSHSSHHHHYRPAYIKSDTRDNSRVTHMPNVSGSVAITLAKIHRAI